jgi:nucleoid-associated protein YgaU
MTMATPARSAGQDLVRAYLEIINPRVPEPIIPLRFNPTEYQLQKQNNFAEIAIPGLEAPPIQFVRGGAERLSLELLVDTSDTLEDVRARYTDKLRGLMNVQSSLHAPPIVRFTWDTALFTGVVESLGITFQLFRPDGVPVRAKLSVQLKEYRPVEMQIRGMRRESPDVEKAYTVRRGDTLSSIAEAEYDDPGLWREIARANRIQDPRAIAPGTVLTLPRLR